MTSNHSSPAALFTTARLALLATAMCFASVAASLSGVRADFALTNVEVGQIGGAALWGLAVGQLVLAPLCDIAGFKRLLLIAAALQVFGVAIMITASGFAMLLTGAALISIGNGAVEAACNPLVATLFPARKAAKLSHFHLWFPGGIAIGGVASFALDSAGVTAWQAKIALILLPMLAYLFRTLGQQFPHTETRAAGIGTVETMKMTVSSLLMWLMIVLMAITASLELGPNRWIPAVIEAGGLPGILVLVFINGIMAVLRGSAEVVLQRFAPTTVLLASTLIVAIGLSLIARAHTLLGILPASAVFACGVAFLWPMMLAVVAERLPRTGATGLGLIAAVGAAFVGLVTTPLMGAVADRTIVDALPVVQVNVLASDVARAGPSLISHAPVRRQFEIASLVATATDGVKTGDQAVAFLRQTIAADPSTGATTRARALLAPAENRGGLVSFTVLTPFAELAALAFLLLILADGRRGGYAAGRARATFVDERTPL